MGCNCKNKIKNIEKYADNTAIREENESNFLEKIWLFLFRIVIGILCGVVIIVGFVPLIGYVTVCLMFGKTPTINLNRINELKKKYSKRK